MSDYYTGWRAQFYNLIWHRYTERTLNAAYALIDFAALHAVTTRLGRPPCALDVACGTSVLLKRLLEQVPELDAYGVDASADMLAQASAALKKWPHVHLEQMEIGSDGMAGLPYEPGTFDLITFTNALHYLPNPLPTLAELARLLAPGGQLVMEDYQGAGAIAHLGSIQVAGPASRSEARAHLYTGRGAFPLQAGRAIHRPREAFHCRLALRWLGIARIYAIISSGKMMALLGCLNSL